LRIYISNLSPAITEEEIRQAFQTFGDVTSVIIAKNNYNGKSRGYGFVEMLRVAEGQAAISVLNGKTLKDCVVVCNALSDWSASGGPRPRFGRRDSGLYGGKEK